MLQPKRTKFRKQMKGRNRGLAHRGSSVSFGEFGLKAEIAGRSLQDIAQELLRIGEQGLKARARAATFDRDEAHFLNALQDIAASGRTAADELLAHYHGDWGGDLDRIYADYSY